MTAVLMTTATNARIKTCGMTWEWTAEIRERIFGAPLNGGYTLERVDEDAYWDRHEEELR
jgi:hypothetical protein